MSERAPFLRRLLVAVDIEHYSARPASTHVDAQRRLLRIVQYACKRARIRQVIPQASGDGRLLVFQPGINEARVVPALVLGFCHGLYENNRVPGDFGPIRMRLAMVAGATATAGNGFAGPASILVGDLVNAPELKRMLESRTESDLAVIVPDPLYQDLISQNYPGLRKEQFSRLDLVLRHQTVIAWTFLPVAGPVPDPAAAPVLWDGVAAALTVRGLAAAAAQVRNRREEIAAARSLDGGHGHHHGAYDTPVYDPAHDDHDGGSHGDDVHHHDGDHHDGDHHYDDAHHYEDEHHYDDAHHYDDDYHYDDGSHDIHH